MTQSEYNYLMNRMFNEDGVTKEDIARMRNEPITPDPEPAAEPTPLKATMTQSQPLYRELASLVDARLRCIKDASKMNSYSEWEKKHEQTILGLVDEYMPSGSGIDCGTKIDLERSTGEKLVFHFSYHHVHESGMYAGWTEHTLTVKASLKFGISLSISGRDRNDVKEYLYETYNYALTRKLPERSPLDEVMREKLAEQAS